LKSDRRKGKMKRLSVVLAVFLVLLVSAFVVAIPSTNSIAGPQYQVDLKYVPCSYSTSGILYNTVSELRQAYNLTPLYASGYNGSGQTVVIVDAYGSPTIYNDLLLFIQWQNAHGANLPWTSLSEVKSHVHIYYPFGKPTFSPLNIGTAEISWSMETTLDVCMVHAIAPGADIALVVAPSPGGNSLNLAVNYAITNHLGSVISQSFGMPEYLLKGNNGQMMQADSNYQLAAEQSITVFASTGDDGATNGGPYNNALFPASDPYVTGVGGTNLFMTCNDSFEEGTGSWDGENHIGAAYSYEIAGNDYEAMVADGHPAPFDLVTTGGAMSSLFPLPTWQSGISLTDTSGVTTTPTKRCTSDVSFDSGVYGGLGRVPYTAYAPYAGWYIFGGTSAGSPFWAALTAIACQAKGANLGFINPQLYEDRATLYSSGALYDITTGDNTFPHDGTVAGYNATIGWDAPTGLGTPNAAILVPIMVAW
jgi:subtilase family serine protease